MDQTRNTKHNDILKRCIEGDRQSFFKIYDLYSKAMLNISYRILNSREDAEEVVQDSFIKAYGNLENFNGESTFGAWLKRITINNSINLVKRRKIKFEDINDNEPAPGNYSDNQEYDDKIELIHRALHELSDGYRIIFSLHLIEGYKHKEIAELLGISLSTSLSQFHRSKQNIKEKIKGYSNV